MDDMFADGLREQAEKLQIPGYFDDSSSINRLVRGDRPKKQSKKIQNEIEQKKEIMRLKKEMDEKLELQR